MKDKSYETQFLFTEKWQQVHRAAFRDVDQLVQGKLSEAQNTNGLQLDA